MNQFTSEIIEWYNHHKRNLPWRHTKDPYIIWISEIILQQTRVAQGYDYFVRFIERFPDIQSLASASEDEVLKYWQGLGYYSRARNLHAAAKSMNGKFPDKYEDVLALKGVGEYTAAAICSFAYHMPYAVLDGNVYRVLARYFNIPQSINTTAGHKLFATLAREMLYTPHPEIYNQAIMDFGALQCVPKSPSCNLCPLIESCGAYSSKLVDKLPVKLNKNKNRNRYFNYFMIRFNDSFVLRKRIADDIWKNLYELPLIETFAELSIDDLTQSNEFISMNAIFKAETDIVFCHQMKHILSHQTLFIKFYDIVLTKQLHMNEDFILVSINDTDLYAMPKPIEIFIEKIISSVV